MAVEVFIPYTTSRKIARGLCTLLKIPKGHQERNIHKFDGLYPENYSIFAPGNDEWLDPDIVVRRRASSVPKFHQNSLRDWRFSDVYQISLGNGREDLSPEMLDELKRMQKRFFISRLKHFAENARASLLRVPAFYHKH